MSDEIVQALARIAKALEDNAVASREIVAQQRESLELHRAHQALAETGETERKAYDAFQREQAAKNDAQQTETHAAFVEMIDTFKREAVAVEERFKTSEAATAHRFAEWERRLDEVERAATLRGPPS